MTIPFELGQPVFIVEKDETCKEIFVYDPPDHIGLRGHTEYEWTTTYKIKHMKFHLELLGSYRLGEIFTNIYDAEKHKRQLERK